MDDGHRFYRAADVGSEEVVLEIESAEWQQMASHSSHVPSPSWAPPTKRVLGFKDQRLKLILNEGNAGKMMSAHGGDMENWIGNRVVLFTVATWFGRERTRGIRIRTLGVVESAAAPLGGGES